ASTPESVPEGARVVTAPSVSAACAPPGERVDVSPETPRHERMVHVEPEGEGGGALDVAARELSGPGSIEEPGVAHARVGEVDDLLPARVRLERVEERRQRDETVRLGVAGARGLERLCFLARGDEGGDVEAGGRVGEAGSQLVGQ